MLTLCPSLGRCDCAVAFLGRSLSEQQAWGPWGPGSHGLSQFLSLCLTFCNTCHGHGGLCEVLRCSPCGCWPHRASRLVRRTLYSPSSLPVALPLLYSRCHLLGSDPVVKSYSNDRCHDLRSLTLCQACAECLTITYYPPLALRKAYFPTL